MTRIRSIGVLLTLGATLALGGCAQLWTWGDLERAKAENGTGEAALPKEGRVNRRLARLEKELQAMRIELGLMNSRMTELVTQHAVAEAPQPPMPQPVAQVAAPKKHAAPKPLPAALPKPAAPMKAGDGTRYFSVHLASYKRRADAVRGWMDLKKRFSGTLKALEPRLADTKLGDKGKFLRLKAGPFPTWSAADKACEALRAKGWICTVMDFSGETLEGV